MIFDVLSESFLHLLLWPIFRQSHSNFRGGRNANASEIWAQLTKNLLTKSSTKRFREYILFYYNLMFCGFQSQNTVRACTIRRLTLGPWCHIKIISQPCRISNLKLNIMNVLYLFYLKKGWGHHIRITKKYHSFCEYRIKDAKSLKRGKKCI